MQQQLTQCRTATLTLFEGIEPQTWRRQAHPDFSPVGWHLGHIGYTEGLWLLEHGAGQAPLFPEYRRLFAADGLPKTERCFLPTFTEICEYLATIRQQVLDYLQVAPLEEQEWLWHWLIQHESQHGETIAWVLQLQRSPGWLGQFSAQAGGSGVGVVTDATAIAATPTAMVQIAAGAFLQGNETLVALDNERPVHGVELDTYWIDRYPVTRGQYREFIVAGGYSDARWWSPEGWRWLQEHPVSQPLYWNSTVAEDHPVCGVSWYEADAYARFVGKRLPTEAEWEKAASWDAIAAQQRPYPWGSAEPTGHHGNYGHQVGQSTPVHQYPQGQSAYGCYDLLGNVWEWTATWFAGYDGFISYPYPGYSQVYFDGQHRVLKGGSWATGAAVLRCAFRNRNEPNNRNNNIGFRLVVSPIFSLVCRQ